MTMITLAEAIHLARQHQQAGNLAEAEAICRQVLQVESQQVEALYLLSVIAIQVGRADLAIEHVRQVIERHPDYVPAYNLLGAALALEGKTAEAIVQYQHALRLKPDSPETHSNLGMALQQQGRLDEAIAHFRQAVQLMPDLAQAHNHLGNALNELGRLDEALACYRQTLQLQPNLVEAHSNLGATLLAQGELERALAAHQQALRLNPTYAAAHSNVILTLQLTPGYDAGAIGAECRRWDQVHAAHLTPVVPSHANDRSPNRRLRIGYVSGDFRQHPVGQCLALLLAAHEHVNFAIFCYASVARPDAITERCRTHADHWYDAVGLSDERLARRIHEDGIDILVDLALHTGGNRLLLFARKPAPVQVTFAGYPGTTGLRAIDYRLTDPYLDPPGLLDASYAEESYRLPHCFWCYDPLTEEPVVAPLPATSHGFVTFGCLNTFCKVNAAVLDLWARILRALPDARLQLLAEVGSQRQRTLDFLAQQGIAKGRLAFVSPRPRPEYLALYQQIDIGLDTFPYNGHTTSLDSLWMGVPVVSLVGQTAVGRGGLSLLSNLGLAELATPDAEQYVSLALELAGDLPRLTQLRASLRERMRQSPLMDARLFARDIENAYRDMWKRWCAR